MKRTNITIKESHLDLLKYVAYLKATTVSGVIRILIEDYLNSHKDIARRHEKQRT